MLPTTEGSVVVETPVKDDGSPGEVKQGRRRRHSSKAKTVIINTRFI